MGAGVAACGRKNTVKGLELVATVFGEGKGLVSGE